MLTVRLAFRNLLRQKRRNLLLGAAVAIGMAILVIANSFSRGISDVLFNRILSYVSGNVSVTFVEGGNRMRQVFRDGERMTDRVRAAVPELVSLEEAVGVFARAVGNGRNDNVILVGMDLRRQATEAEMEDLRDNFRMIEGTYTDLLRDDIENPVLLGEDKAKSLNVRLHDVLRVRFQDVNGQNQAARLTVAGIFKPANAFMNAPVFLDLAAVKRLAGYGPGDIGLLYLMLPDPQQTAIPAADRLHAALTPPLAAALGQLESGENRVSAAALGFKVDSVSLEALSGLLPGFGSARPLTSRDVLLGEALARELGVGAGDRCAFSYAPYAPYAPLASGTTGSDRAMNESGAGGERETAYFTVTAVLPPSPVFPDRALLVNDRDFYAFQGRVRRDSAALAAARSRGEVFVPDSSHALHPWLGREWVLLERSATTEELQQKYRALPRLKTRSPVVDVATMYETASMVVNLEYALNLITLVAVMVLFFIIQVGVVNTLRMTIRERTREIGTMRAIGMQRDAVRNLFLAETVLLSVFACAVGVALAFGGMWLLRQIVFDPGSNPLSMLLVHGRLHFKASPAAIGAFFLLLLVIAAATAWFPARTAARLRPSEALRHYG